MLISIPFSISFNPCIERIPDIESSITACANVSEKVESYYRQHTGAVCGGATCGRDGGSGCGGWGYGGSWDCAVSKDWGVNEAWRYGYLME